ncbi:hypothetical protein [Flavobacterium sp.]|jgi:hypothetical protein|uniref:hypothetical protein n=1 Tax=Flavobacterium sp. TaxID=239 RepID=UPI0037C0B7A6
MINIDIKVFIKENTDIIISSLILDYWRIETNGFLFTLDMLSKKYLIKMEDLKLTVSKYSTLQIRLPCQNCKKNKQIQITNRNEFKTSIICRVCKLKQRKKSSSKLINELF